MNKYLNFFNRINYYNFIKKGGNKMYVYRFDDEITKAAVNKIADEKQSVKNNDEKTLFDKLYSIEEKFKIDNEVNIESELNLEKLENIEIDEGEVKKEAEDELIDYKNNSLNKINNDKEAGDKKLNDKKEDLTLKANEEKTQIQKTFDDAKTKAWNSAIDQGIARSSIIISEFDAFDKDEIEQFTDLDSKLTNSINAIDVELKALEQKQKQAVSDFDISYAVKLDSKIKKLMEELQKKQDQITKYNNTIEQKEEEYRLKYLKLEQEVKDKNFKNELDIVKLIGKYGPTIVNKYKQNLMYNEIKQYLVNFSNEDALNFLNKNSNLKSSMGNYYDLLLKDYS